MTPTSSPDDSRPPSKELRRLVDGLFTGTLSRVEFTQLEELLENDSGCRRYYLEIAANEALLPEAAQGLQHLPPPEAHRPRTLIHFGAVLAAAAALVLAYAMGVSRSAGDRNIENLEPLANETSPSHDHPVRITGGVGVAWNEGDPAAALSFGSSLPTNQVSIESGLLELTYANGVNVLLEGPARYEITGENSGALEFGNLVAEVPPGAEGFTIDYAGDRVVDHGTQFGLRLPKDTGIPEVAVFRGEVDVFHGSRSIPARLTPSGASRQSRANSSPSLSIVPTTPASSPHESSHGACRRSAWVRPRNWNSMLAASFASPATTASSSNG